MKNSELRGYVAPPEPPASLGGLVALGLAAFAVTGLALVAFLRPDLLTGAWASISGGGGRTQFASGSPSPSAPPAVKAQVLPNLRDAQGEMKKVSGYVSMLGSIGSAGSSALGMQDVMMGNVKDPAKAAAIMEQHSKNLEKMQKDSSRVLGIPDLNWLDLADDTPVGAAMLKTCASQAGEQESRIFKKPAAIARFTNCYMTTKPERLCDPEQKKVLVEVLGWYGASQKFWKLEAEGRAGVSFTNAPKAPDWDNPAWRAFPATLARLGAQGYISAADLGWRTPDYVKTALADVKAAATPCAVAQK